MYYHCVMNDTMPVPHDLRREHKLLTFYYEHESGFISSHSVQYAHLTILSDERLTRGEKIVHIGGGHPKDTDQLMSTELRGCRQIYR